MQHPDFNLLFPTINTITATGKIRSIPEDFRVTELNDIELSGDGEHLWLYIQKTSHNSDWVAKQLSNVCQVPRKHVGFAGLKDRHAITEQWFSVQLPKISDLKLINKALGENISVLRTNKHKRKIKTGQLDANRFEIVIRAIDGHHDLIETNIKNIIAQGVPNYFGPQRFGHEMGNIQKAAEWFAGNYKVKSKNLKSLLISTARSHIFNTIVAQRIKNKTWDQPIEGDIFQLDKSHSWFHAKDATTDEIHKRLTEFDIHISGAMWGEDPVQSESDCAQLENKIGLAFEQYKSGFEKFRLKQDRRSMRIYPIDLKHRFNDNQLILNFSLYPGSYATSILREIIQVD